MPYIKNTQPVMQDCQNCEPTEPAVGRGNGKDTEGERVRAARVNGNKTYKSLDACKACGGVIRFVVGQRCVPCITAAYADSPTAPLPPQVYSDVNAVKATRRTRRLPHPIADDNRNTALETKATKFDATNLPCPKCNTTVRYTKTSMCVSCSHERSRTTRLRTLQTATLMR